jgi:hypothetical protein
MLLMGLGVLAAASRWLPPERVGAASAVLLGTIGAALFALSSAPRVSRAGQPAATEHAGAPLVGPRLGGEPLSN